MTALLGILALLCLAAAAPLVARVKREYERGGVLSGATVASVWVLYLAIAAVVVLAAILGSWEMGLPAGVALGVGLPLITLGLALEVTGLASMASLRRMSGVQPDRLIAGGAFRYSRNPQNVGIGLALAGAAIAGDSALALAATAGFWLIFRAYVGYEEEHLARTFGPAYESYRQRTARFLGRPG